MTLEDLQHIFSQQIESAKEANISDTKLYYILVDGEFKMVDRHPMNKLEELLPVLSSFQYVGSSNNMPRFIK
jgi:hypothetical protein